MERQQLSLMVKGDEGARFENMVAISLLKHVNAIEDYEGKRASLHYLRTKEKKEVDFAVAIEDQPVRLIDRYPENTMNSGSRFACPE